MGTLKLANAIYSGDDCVFQVLEKPTANQSAFLGAKEHRPRLVVGQPFVQFTQCDHHQQRGERTTGVSGLFGDFPSDGSQSL